MFRGIPIRLRPVTLLIAVLAIALGLVPISVAARANRQASPSGPPTPTEATPMVVTAGDTGPYYSMETITLSDGIQLERINIHGPAKPPPGTELERTPVKPAAVNQPGAAVSLPVPAYDWVFGCSAVSASMIGAYFDRNGLPNIYAGPANGGVMPMDNSTVWGTWNDGDKTYPLNPLVASRTGLDGRASKGSIDDYWVKYDSTAQDPYITGGWAQHIWGDAFGDYMKTSQSVYGNTDGSTYFNWYTNGTPMTCANMESLGLAEGDGSYGRKLFYEAHGISVTACFNQRTDNVIAGGFSFANYKAQIDAGFPVLLNLAGHSIVGVGYLDPSTVYINDTWDHATHQMTWGGSYTDMVLQSVSVVNPVVSTPPPTITGLNPSSATPGGPAFTLTVNGTGFVDGAVVRWNGAARTTVYVSSTKLTAAIAAADIASAGTASVTVLNPGPGGVTSNAVSFVVGTSKKVYLPFVVKSPPVSGPTPGFWQHPDGRMEFYVTSNRGYVDDFAIHVDVDGCGHYKITHHVQEPISGNHFSFTGPFYASGTFSTQTAASGTVGLSSFFISGCGNVTGGPWAWSANWLSSVQLTPVGATKVNQIHTADQGPAFEVTRIQ
jgi:hypothetical protein